MCARQCSICLETKSTTQNVTALDENKVKFSVKLQYIAPEVEWLENYLICRNCVEQLNSAYEFKTQCLAVNLENKLEVEERDKSLIEFGDDTIGNEYENYDSDSCSVKEEKCEDSIISNSTQNDFFICYDCGGKHKTKSELVRHIRNSHLNNSRNDRNNGIYKLKQFECTKCGRKYVLETTLNEHLPDCDGIRRHVKTKAEYQCDRCRKYYTTKKILKAHKKRCRHEVDCKKTEYQCTSCNKYYISLKTLKDHYKRGCKKEKSDNVQVIFCKICDEYFKSLVVLKQHILAEHKTSDYHCLICVKNFDTKEVYDLHMTSEHVPKKIGSKRRGRVSTRKFTCEVCNEEFTLLKAIIEHCVNVHSMDRKMVRPYSCEKCDNRFRSSTNLINHRLYHDRNRTNICSFCGKSFITKNDLTAHEYTHFNCRNYKCDKCEKAFKTNTNLRTHHLIVHTDPSLWKYVCHICNKRFPQKSNHDQHIRRHIGEKNFICPLCKKPFASKSEMQEHVSFHSNVRAYKCDHCGKEYRKKHTYDVHLAKVHGVGNTRIPVREKKHACHICPSRFYDRLKLARHLFHTFRETCIKSNIIRNEILKQQLEDINEFKSEVYDIKPEDNQNNFENEADNDIKEDDEDENEYDNDDPNDSSCSDEDNKNSKLNLKSEIVEVKLFIITSYSLCSIEEPSPPKRRRKVLRFQCEKCPNSYVSSTILVKHCVEEHEMKSKNVRPFACTRCSSRSHKLVVHTDPQLWKYFCQICNKRFPIKSNYDCHMRRHTGDKKFECHLCNKRFTDKCVLQRHMRTHSNVRDFKCSECAKEYKDKRVMQIHMAKIHGIGIGEIKLPSKERKYICHICPKAYYAKNKLTRHLYTHSGEKPFFCTICDKKFNDKSYVKQHMKKTHNVDTDADK
ncbi:hypothetical protein NQ314_018462 [Rhamnusium bicolor]|uniref:C2H2-type domain-containing protein n=1 Tax=Rhamnusium bicolor TaxID=1586634 RepID=A0AAV8WR21_9CUCU|nr:hypothetical protein NQ314_018462 [Rhamnusium bicolor]